ncbi:hypothetical protein GCM10010405_13050 [Streptomyces macrosporus]|uniref:Uncharacterized protein n=1 Tax=Streptomyces macrosporus TaxID=44032 RepID=A0ABP5WR42_9ACTN
MGPERRTSPRPADPDPDPEGLKEFNRRREPAPRRPSLRSRGFVRAPTRVVPRLPLPNAHLSSAVTNAIDRMVADDVLTVSGGAVIFDSFQSLSEARCPFRSPVWRALPGGRRGGAPRAPPPHRTKESA